MSSPRTVIATGLIDHAFLNATLKAAVTDSIYTDGKGFLLAAPDNAQPPYLKVEWVFGGEPARTPVREFDQWWIAAIVAFDQDDAITLDALLRDQLVGSRPTLIEGWRVWDSLTVSNEYEKQMILQGQTLWTIGAYYRIRGVK
jgi:hypothetical protein